MAEPKRIVSIADLMPDAQNANQGTERGAYMLRQSMYETGAGRSIVVDANGVVLAGNKTLETAEELDLPITVVQTQGDRLVVVQRTDLDLTQDERARKLAYYDNRAGEVGLSWNAAQIAADLEAGLVLDDMFRGEELGAILERAADEMLAEQYVAELDAELGALDGLEDVTIAVVVPAKHADGVKEWLANGEMNTGAGLGRGVMRRCGLL